MIKVLGIESSCDDSAAAIISEKNKILSNIVISQNAQHIPFNGVVPEIAARSHLSNIEIAITASLKESNLNLEDIDVIAATCGPGLIGGVIVGSVFGKALASRFSKPFIAVNHLEGHALTVRLTNEIEYPYLLLLASGGHSQFVAVRGLGDYIVLGQTIDDSAGEAFDKVAKMLNLPFPGGPIIEKLAYEGNPQAYNFPKPLINRDDCDLSFSGLKTAVRLQIEKLVKDSGILTPRQVNDIAASFQYTICEVLSIKMLQAIKKYEKFCQNKIVVIAGGVGSNQYLKRIIEEKIRPMGYEIIVPPINLCTDNAAMIAYVGLERFKAGVISDLSFCPRPRWGLNEINIY